MSHVFNKEDWLKQAKELFGEEKKDWSWVCSDCGRSQSANSITKQFADGFASKRHGIVPKGKRLFPYCECYDSRCNWVAYGLFNSGIIVINDPAKPHNIKTKENCAYVFPFAEKVAEL